MLTDAGQPTTESRKRQVQEEKIQDHLIIHKIKRFKISTIQLEEDLLYEIFVRLPVKSLIRFRCVSKGTRTMIDSPFFAKKHNNHRRSLSDDYAIILKQCSGLFSVNFSNINLNCANTIKLDFTFPNKSPSLIGCCNGIFCLKIWEVDSYILWNPSNGTFQKVECPCLPSNITEESIVNNESIGYDHVNDDYKISKISKVRDDTSLTFEVYSFRKQSWRTFNGTLSPDLFTVGEGVCVSGAMHWLSSNLRFITAFDFVTETFRSIPLPQEATQLELTPFQLKEFRGHLCVVFRPSVWVMEKYGVERSWTKIDNINSSIQFYHFPNRERRLLSNSRWLTWWDPLDHSYERIIFPGSSSDQPRYCPVHIYVRNLVRLDQSFI